MDGYDQYVLYNCMKLSRIQILLQFTRTHTHNLLFFCLPPCTAGSHFFTAKELTEEIWALSSEREGLELLLGRLLALSSRNVRRLGSVKEDYIRCRQDLALQEAAHSE